VSRVLHLYISAVSLVEVVLFRVWKLDFNLVNFLWKPVFELVFIFLLQQ
jgi:hypothetical protein